MNALITGITGFVASYLAKYLLAETDWAIYGTMRWNEPLDNLESIRPFIGNRITLLEMDLNDRSSIDAAVKEAKPDFIYHLAAQSYVQASLVYPVQTLQTNVIGTANLLESLRYNAHDAWIHNCSSSEVYGQVTQNDIPIREDCPLRPASPYSISKIGQDMLGRYYAEAYGMNVVTTRMFTHTGPGRGDVFVESSFAKEIAMIEAELAQPPIHIVNPKSVRTIADVRDAVRAYHMLLTVNPQPGEVYNIGGNHSCTVREILNTLLSIAGKDYPAEYDPSKYRPIDVSLQIPDCSKFSKHTGWKPEILFEQTMSDLLEYWRAKVKTYVVIQR